MDYATRRTSDEETATAAATNTEREDPSSPRVDQESSSRSSSASSSSSEEPSSTVDDPLGALAPDELAVLLWEETKASIRAIRENRTPAPLSAGSAEVTVSISRHQAAPVHEAAMVSELGPVLPVTTTAVVNSIVEYLSNRHFCSGTVAFYRRRSEDVDHVCISNSCCWAECRRRATIVCDPFSTSAAVSYPDESIVEFPRS